MDEGAAGEAAWSAARHHAGEPGHDGVAVVEVLRRHEVTGGGGIGDATEQGLEQRAEPSRQALAGHPASLLHELVDLGPDLRDGQLVVGDVELGVREVALQARHLDRIAVVGLRQVADAAVQRDDALLDAEDQSLDAVDRDLLVDELDLQVGVAHSGNPFSLVGCVERSLGVAHPKRALGTTFRCHAYCPFRVFSVAC